MKMPNFKKTPCIVWCLVLNAGFFLCWYVATPSLFNSYNSPHYVYRLEVYNASIFQRVVNYKFKEPSVVRLYRVEPKILLGESKVTDLWMDGEISWVLDAPVKMGRVHVGNEVIFENIPPECAEISPIPGCPRSNP